MRMSTIAAIAAVTITATPVLSATFDFSGVTAPVGTSVTIPGATFTAEDKGLRVGIDGVNSGMAGDFCFLDSISSCAGSGRIDFASDITSISLMVHGLQNLERVTISAFHKGVQIGSEFFQGTGLAATPFEVSFNGLIDRLTFVDTSDIYRNGASFGSVTYTPAPAPIPLPAAGWMLLAGLAGMAGLRRRAKT